MTTQINNIKETEFSVAYSEAIITDISDMSIAELDRLTEELGVDILVF